MKVRNKKVICIALGIAAVILITIGITYAYWLITKNQKGENVITSACLDISLTNEQNDIELTNQFPLSDEDGMKLTPYEFTVTNNCNTSVDYHINLESIGAESEAIIPSALKAMLDENAPQVLSSYSEKATTIEDAYEAHLLGAGTLSAKGTEGSSASHSLRLWIDEDAPISEMNKTFRSKITAIVGQGIEAIQGSTLATLILEDAETNNYLYSTAPDFSKGTEWGEYGLYTAPDDYGTSYYFRGDIQNNYVQLGTWKESSLKVVGCYDEQNVESCVGSEFKSMEECEADTSSGYAICREWKYADKGNEMYWRIVRINGDNSIRLVYDGLSAVANRDKHITSIGESVYNTNSNDAKYVGYTYDVDGTETDSIIKGVVDEFYTKNLEADYGKYMADAIYCNDKEIISTNGKYISFAPLARLMDDKNPILTCTNQNDRYTVDDVEKGNGLLTKPIGLMTADEIAMAGIVFETSGNSYLYNDSFDWTMSPTSTNEVWIVWYGGVLYSNLIDTSAVIEDGIGNGIRPVINLKADSLFTGSGTIDDPYKIVTE